MPVETLAVLCLKLMMMRCRMSDTGYTQRNAGIWNGCCDQKYKLRSELTPIYNVGGGANVIKRLGSRKEIRGWRDETAQRRIIPYKLKVGYPCPSVSAPGPGLVMYQDFWAVGTHLVCIYRPWVAGRYRNFDMT